MLKHSERRKEKRLEVSGRYFVEVSQNGGTPKLCPIKNLSRLGVGFESADNGSTGEVLDATLLLKEQSISVKLITRIASGKFVGAEFFELSSDNAKKIRSFLNPKYIASSIHTISSDHLAPHVAALHQGDDFECIVFKPGVSGPRSQVQILWKGRVVEVINGKARFVPPMLIRDSGVDFEATALLKTFGNLEDPGSIRELGNFFKSLHTVLKAWDLCPLELHALVRKQLERTKENVA